MKTKEEIEQLAEQWYNREGKLSPRIVETRSFIKGYTQCQEDMADKIKVLEKKIESMYEDLAGEDI